jgi:hypothetical protein
VKGIKLYTYPVHKRLISSPLKQPLAMTALFTMIEVLEKGFFQTLDDIKGLPLKGMVHIAIKSHQFDQALSSYHRDTMEDYGWDILQRRPMVAENMNLVAHSG